MTSAAILGPPRPELGRRVQWLLAAAHLPLLFVPAVLAVVLDDTPSRLGPASTVALGVGAAAVVTALQIRHGLAAASGVRPRGWPVTLLATAVLVYLPLAWLPTGWIVTQWALVASLVLFLPRRVALPLGALIVVGSETLLTLREVAEQDDLGPAVTAWVAVYNLLVAGFGPTILVAATLLVRVLDDLSAARAELAEAAVAQERLRISRDLHDVLGQSLSAVSLKGDLAMRLLPADRAAAMAEVESLTAVARAALRDISTVTFDRHPTSVPGELNSAAGLLRAAGIRTRIEVALPEAPRVQDDALGWVLREGVTNVLRHSAATQVTIRAGQRDGRIHLEIVNDGARASEHRHHGAPGSGLAGLTARVGPLGGVLTAEPLDGDRFRLAVDIPEELP